MTEMAGIWTPTGIFLLCSLLLLSGFSLEVNGEGNGFRPDSRSGPISDGPSYHPDQIIMNGDEERILGKGTYGNITLSGNSSLKVLGDVNINGIVKIEENAVLNVTGAEMDIIPPPIGVNDNVMRLEGNGRLNIVKGSIFRIFPQPITQEDRYKRNNASFVEVDDLARILVEDSTFTAILPGDAVPEETRVTGGTILITGYGEFISRRSRLNAYLNYTLFDDGSSISVIMERWFWMSIQRYGTILIEDSEAILNEPGQTIFKPTNGKIILRNSTIYGNVRPETISTFEITNCEIHNIADQIGYSTIREALEMNDHASGTVTNSRIIGEVKIGWSSTNEFLGKADNQVRFTNCTFDSEKILTFSNTTLILDNCDFVRMPGLEITDNSVLELIDTHIDDLVVECGIVERLKAIKENVTIIMDNSRLDHVFNPDPDVVFNFHLKNGSSIGLFDMHFNNEFQNKTANVILEDGSTILFNNSHSGRVNLILRNAPRPASSTGEEFTVHERYILQGVVRLNTKPLAQANTQIEIGNLILRSVSGNDGNFEFEYDARTWIADQIVQEIPISGNLTVTFLGLKSTREIITFSDNQNVIDLTDEEPPQILKVDWDPKTLDQQKFITVSAVITDNGSNVVGGVILQYRRGDGIWTNVTMFNINGSTYEGVIPRSKIGQTVEFRIVAVDAIGNEIEGETNGIEIGEEFIIGGWVLLVSLSILIIAGFTVNIIKKLRSRRYLRSEFKGDRRTLDDLSRKGVI